MAASVTNGAASSGTNRHSSRVVVVGNTARILCVADIRGDFHELNRLIREHEATAVIHTGDFGFLDQDSLGRMADKILRHLLQYSPLLPEMTRKQLLAIPQQAGREALISQLNSSSIHFPLSQLPHLISGAITFSVPVFTVWGLIEDVRIIEKLRTGEYDVKNLHIIDEASAPLLEVAGIKLRMHGLGGALAHHKLFDTGEGFASIAGGQGTMWTTALQIGELVDTASKVYDPSETRLLITSAALSRLGLLTQLALTLKIDLTISGGLHFRYPASYNDFAVHESFDAYRQKLVQARENFASVYDLAKDRVDASMNEQQQILFKKALAVTQRIPSTVDDSWTSTWNFVLTDASNGHLLLSITDARISAEMKSQGLNFAHRTSNGISPPSMPSQPVSTTPVPLPSTRAPSAAAPTAGGVESKPPIRPIIPSAPAVRPAMTGAKPTPPPGVKAAIPAKPATPISQGGSAGPAPPTAPAARPLAQPVRPPRGPGALGGQPIGGTAGPSKDKERLDAKPVPSPSAEGGKHTPQPSKDRNAVPPKPTRTPAATDVKATSAEQKKDGAVNGSAVVNGNGHSNGSAVAAVAANDADKEESEISIPTSPRRVSLYIKGLPIPTTEDEIKAFFGTDASKIVNVKLVYDMFKKVQKNFAYVDFGSEVDMQAALGAHSSGSIRDTPITVEVSNPPPPRGDFGRGGRGRGIRGGRGGSGGGSAGGRGGSVSGSTTMRDGKENRDGKEGGAREGKEGKEGKKEDK